MYRPRIYFLKNRSPVGAVVGERTTLVCFACCPARVLEQLRTNVGMPQQWWWQRVQLASQPQAIVGGTHVLGSQRAQVVGPMCEAPPILQHTSNNSRNKRPTEDTNLEDIRTHKRPRSNELIPSPLVTPPHWTSDMSFPPRMSPVQGEFCNESVPPVNMFSSSIDAGVTSMNTTLRQLHLERENRRQTQQDLAQRSTPQQQNSNEQNWKRRQELPVSICSSKRQCTDFWRSRGGGFSSPAKSDSMEQ